MFYYSFDKFYPSNLSLKNGSFNNALEGKNVCISLEKQKYGDLFCQPLNYFLASS